MTDANQAISGSGAKTCSQCGAAFSCEVAAGQSQCWCFSLPRIIAVDEADDKGCLCPACLGAKIEERLQEQQAAQSLDLLE